MDQELRDNLINKGTIKTAQPEIPTKKLRRQERMQLIKLGIIDPTLCQLPEVKLPRPSGEEEGEYKVRPIINDIEYFQRRQAYFRMLQEVLYARKELKLVLGSKGPNDPEWIF
jgi:hypothetical protein